MFRKIRPWNVVLVVATWSNILSLSFLRLSVGCHLLSWGGLKTILTLSFTMSFASSPLSWNITRHLTFRRNTEHILWISGPIKWLCLTFPAERSKPPRRKDQWLLPKILVALTADFQGDRKDILLKKEKENKVQWHLLTFWKLEKQEMKRQVKSFLQIY